MDNKKTILTKQGFADLKQEYDELVNLKRVEAVERLARARAFGDLSENSEYHAAKEELAFIDRRKNELEEVFKNLSIVDDSNSSHVGKNQVYLGSKVTVMINNQGRQVFQIVGSLEADPRIGKISNEAPLGKLLLGAKVGEEIEIGNSPKTIYKVIAVE